MAASAADKLYLEYRLLTNLVGEARDECKAIRAAARAECETVMQALAGTISRAEELTEELFRLAEEGKTSSLFECKIKETTGRKYKAEEIRNLLDENETIKLSDKQLDEIIQIVKARIDKKKKKTIVPK